MEQSKLWKFWCLINKILLNCQQWKEKCPSLVRDFHCKSPKVDVVGAIDGTFIKIRRPKNHSNHYYCRKMFIALHKLAMCDWTGRFTYVQVGDPGNTHDSNPYLRSNLHNDIAEGRYPLTVNGYKLLTDSAFPQTTFIVRTNLTNAHRNRTLDYMHMIYLWSNGEQI